MILSSAAMVSSCGPEACDTSIVNFLVITMLHDLVGPALRQAVDWVNDAADHVYG